ncbi:MAG: flagellar biosynthetic protein FliR [Myxococcota bacterium]
MFDSLDFGLGMPWVMGALFIALRLGAALAMLAEVGRGIVPARTRLAMVLVLTICLDLSLGGVTVAVPTGPAWPASLLIMAAREVVLGSSLGLAVRLINSAVQMAGDLVGLSMGLSLATLFDQTAGELPLATGRLFGLVASLMFFAMGGHLVVVAGLFAHLKAYPVGVDHIVLPSLTALSQALSDSVETAVILAAPVLVVSLLLNVAMGFVMRLVPSVNLFNIGVGVLMVGGFVALAFESAAMRVSIDRQIEELPERMDDLAGQGVPP